MFIQKHVQLNIVGSIVDIFHRTVTDHSVQSTTGLKHSLGDKI